MPHTIMAVDPISTPPDLLWRAVLLACRTSSREVKEGDACWLYRVAVSPDKMEQQGRDQGWWCGVKTAA